MLKGLVASSAARCYANVDSFQITAGLACNNSVRDSRYSFGKWSCEVLVNTKRFARAVYLFNGESPACRDGGKGKHRLLQTGLNPGRLSHHNHYLLNAVSGKGGSF